MKAIVSFISFVFFFIISNLNAQAPQGLYAHTNSQNSPGTTSDYYFFYGWTGWPGHPGCPGYEDRRIQLFSNSVSATGLLINQPAAANRVQAVGINWVANWTMFHQIIDHDGGGNQCWIPASSTHNFFAHATQPYMNPPRPGSVVVDSINYDSVEISWEKGTDYPDAEHFYKIYLNGIEVQTVDGTERSTWVDITSLEPNADFTIGVSNLTSNSSHESTAQSTVATRPQLPLVATDGTYSDHVRISWPTISQWSDEIKISRDGVDLGIISKWATNYSDYNAIPGFDHNYSLEIINASGIGNPNIDNGHTSPNGKIRGFVTSTQGAGVDSVLVTAMAINNIPAGVDAPPYIYQAYTDPTGYYEMANIYYHTGNGFKVYPAKTDHGFIADTVQRFLDQIDPIANNVNFTDTTVFSVSGNVFYSNTGCGLNGADILLDGSSIGISSDEDGNFSLSVQEEGSYQISVEYLDHEFSVPVQNVNVTQNVSGISFENITTDTVSVRLLNGCGTSVAATYDLHVKSTESPVPCFSETFSINAADTLLVLPAQEYEFSINSGVPNGPSTNVTNQLQPILADLTQRDSSTAAMDSVSFVYHEAIVVSVIDPSENDDCPGLHIFDQGVQQVMEIKVEEVFTDYSPSTATCPVKNAELIINNVVSDSGLVAPVMVNPADGRYFHSFIVGQPNIATPYLKNINIQATAFFEQDLSLSALPYNENFVVQGSKARTNTFFTKTPEIPMLILHDPPGDESISFIESGSSHSHIFSTSYEDQSSLGAYVDARIGTEFSIPFTSISAGLGVSVDYDYDNGSTQTNGNELISTITTSELISTSSDELLNGGDGDIYMGASYNVIYGISDILTVDESTCDAVLDQDLFWNPTDVKTTYLYSEAHVKDILIPQLEGLEDILQNDLAMAMTLQDSVVIADTLLFVQSSKRVWNDVLLQNQEIRNSPSSNTFVENRSFSAGAVYNSSMTEEVSQSTDFEYETYISHEIAAGLFGFTGDAFDIEAGVKISMRTSSKVSSSVVVSTTKTTGYELSDNDIGDFYSIDIHKDPRYGTPMFKLVAGNSSCPYETGTLRRDMPQISCSNPSQINVPADELATYYVQLSNLSESDEQRDYAVELIGSSNPDAAIVRLAGQTINSNPVEFDINGGQTITVGITVEKSPFASVYDDLQLRIYPPCEEDYTNNQDALNADTLSISAHFQSDCSPVELYAPNNNFLVTQLDMDLLRFTLTGYNVNDPELNGINLQYRQTGTWSDLVFIPVDSLSPTLSFYDYDLDISGLSDGDYEFRAQATCGINSYSVSSVAAGTIDRTSIVLFGTPSPSDGVLHYGDEIAAVFSGDIDPQSVLDPNSVLLLNSSMDTLMRNVTINSNEILITPTAQNPLSTLQGEELFVVINHLTDISGNSISDTIAWNFVVDQSLVRWTPSNVIATNTVGSAASFVGVLENQDVVNQNYTLVDIAPWLTASSLNGSIPAEGTEEITFEISSTLAPGTYQDTVVALTSNSAQLLFVTVEVSGLSPTWTVNSADYQYSMSMVAQFSLNQSDTLLSDDSNDLIAAFIDNEVRGVANIEYDAGSDLYRAFLTVYSNNPIGEEIEFQFWDALPSITYAAIETEIFELDEAIGDLINPLILHPKGLVQSVPVLDGWNWISTFAQNTDMSIQTLLQNVDAEPGDIIKSQTAYSQFSVNGWFGNLEELNTKDGYLIYLSNPDTLEFVGSVADSTQMALNQGWNWTAYPRNTIGAIDEALETWEAEHGDQVKSQTQFSTYDSLSQTWVGNLDFMHPGQGYKVFSNNAASFQFKKSVSDSLAVNENDYQYTMTMTSVLNISGNSPLNSNYMILAYINDTLRGSVELQYITDWTNYYGFLTIHGNVDDVGETIEFKVYDILGDEFMEALASQAVDFGLDYTLASIETPITLFVNPLSTSGISNAVFDFSIYPNPAEDHLVIDLALGNYTCTIRDAKGSVVLEENVRGRKVLDVQDFNAGIYVLSIEDRDSGESTSVKFVKY